MVQQVPVEPRDGERLRGTEVTVYDTGPFRTSELLQIFEEWEVLSHGVDGFERVIVRVREREREADVWVDGSAERGELGERREVTRAFVGRDRYRVFAG